MNTLNEKLAQACYLRETNQLDEALALYQAIINDYPKELEALLGFGYIYRQRGQRAQALAHFRLLEQDNPENLWIKLAIIEELRDTGQYQPAFELISILETEKPNDFFINFHKAQLYRQEGNREQALLYFEKACALNADDLWGQLSLAAELTTQNAYEKALMVLNNLQEKHPENFQVFFHKGRLYRQQGDTANALLCFQQAAAFEPNNFWALLELAIELRDEGKFTEAAVYFELLQTNHAANFNTQFHQGHWYRQQGDRANALLCFQRAAALEPANMWGKIAISEELRDTGEFDAALQLLNSIEKDNSNAFNIFFHKAHVYKQWGNRKQSLLYFKKACQLKTNNIWGELSLAAELCDQGNYQKALDILNGLHQQYPNNSQIFIQQGFLYRQQGNREQALACFQQAIEQGDNHPDNLLQLAIEQFSLGQLTEAIASLSIVLKNQPDNLAALLQLGHWLNGANCREQALSYFEQALAAHPYQLHPYLSIAQSLFDLGKSQESFLLLAKATKNCGDKVEIYAQKATLLWSSREIAAALETIEHALVLFPDNYNLQLQYIYYLIELGDFNQANELIEKLSLDTLNKKLQVKLLHAKIFEKQWLVDKAILLYEQILVDCPHYIDAHHALRRLSLLKLNVVKAKKHALAITTYSLGEQKINGQQGRGHLHDHVAQLTDEYLLNRATLTQLENTITLKPPVRLQQLAAIVVNEKTATSAAITFLAELRQQQYFNQGIPKRIFQYWDSIKPPAEVINFTNSWLKHNPEYQHQLFNEQTARDFLRNTYHAEVLTAYINASHAAQKADILRLALLYEYGGIYADVDDVCLKPLALLIPKHTKLLLYQEEYGTVGNNFIAVCAKHPVLKQALTYAIEALLQGDKESIWLSTGPAMVSRALALYLAKQWSQTTPAELQIVIITREELMRVVGIHGQLPYKNSHDSWLIKEFNSGERFDLTKVIL